MRTIMLLGAKSQLAPLESVPAELSQLKQQFTDADLSLTVEYEPYLTQKTLVSLLTQYTDKIDVLHFAGHSNAQQLETNDAAVYGHHIADVLATWSNKPSLVFLNGCHNADQVDNFLNAGVDCVIATHQAIDDKEAARFAGEFYSNLLSQPDQVTVSNAFKRAGSLVLLGEPRKARTLDIDELHRDSNVWDWGLFCKDTARSKQWTMKPSSPPLSDFFKQKKRERAEERWQRLFDRITAIKTQYDLETKQEEKIRMEHIIQQNQQDLDAVEAEIELLSH